MADFHKYHGLGNDYIIIDPNHNKVNLTKKNIRLLCNRNLGIGSDGILYGPIIENSKINLKIFNPDGSEAEKSGNGVRIFAQYLYESGHKNLTIQTKGGEVTATIINPEKHLIKVNMGKFLILKDNKKITIDNNILKYTFVTLGNPHCVIIQDKISEKLTKEFGPTIEKHSDFPNHTNVQFVQIIDRNNIKIEIWERGAGYTLASGSSSCAAACASNYMGLTDKNITVNMPGGKLEIEIMPNNSVSLTGPVTKIASGNFAEDLWRLLKCE